MEREPHGCVVGFWDTCLWLSTFGRPQRRFARSTKRSFFHIDSVSDRPTGIARPPDTMGWHTIGVKDVIICQILSKFWPACQLPVWAIIECNRSASLVVHDKHSGRLRDDGSPESFSIVFLVWTFRGPEHVAVVQSAGALHQTHPEQCIETAAGHIQALNLP